MPNPAFTIPSNPTDSQQLRQTLVQIQTALRTIGILTSTTGAPVDAPTKGTARFDPATATLWVYADSGWVSTVLT